MDERTDVKLAVKCEISVCGTYRYWLRYRLARARPPRVIGWIGLNPSTADADRLDPTMRAVLKYSQRWGFGQCVMLNLFAFRATDPRQLKRAIDPIGPDNDRVLVRQIQKLDLLIAAWGVSGSFLGRDIAVRELIREAHCVVGCLKLTKQGFPHHPLYVPGKTGWIEFPV